MPDTKPADVTGDPMTNAVVTAPLPADGPQDVSQDSEVDYDDAED